MKITLVEEIDGCCRARAETTVKRTWFRFESFFPFK